MPSHDAPARRGRGKRIGRPDGLTDRTREVLLDALRRGHPIITACALAGTTRHSFYRWMKKADQIDYAIAYGYPWSREDLKFRQFRDSVLRARAEAADRMVGIVMDAAIGGQLASEGPALNSKGDPIRNQSGEVIMERKWTAPDGWLALQYLKTVHPQAAWADGMDELDLADLGGASFYGDGQRPVDPAAIDRIATAIAAVRQRRAERESPQPSEASIETADPGVATDESGA